MSDRKALAREIAARTAPRFVEIKKEREWRPTAHNEERASRVRKRLARLVDD